MKNLNADNINQHNSGSNMSHDHHFDDGTPDLSEVPSGELFAELCRRFKRRITGSAVSNERKFPPSKPPQTIHEPQVQVIHKYVINEQPEGLIGERVVYGENYLKSLRSNIPLVPECGYFTITKAVLHYDGRVTVALHPSKNHNKDDDGTHICLSELKKYSRWDNDGKTKLADFIEVMVPHMGSKLRFRLNELRQSYGIRYLEDIREVMICATRGVGPATFAEFQRIKEKYEKEFKNTVKSE